MYHLNNRLISKDCDDVSDEKNCKIIFIDPEKYLKSKPPPSADSLSKLPISLRYFKNWDITLLKILF